MDNESQKLKLKEFKLHIENEDKKEDSMRHMAWFSLLGMLLYPFLIMLCDIFHFDKALVHLASLAETYFISVSGIISVYFGSNAWSKRQRNKFDQIDQS